MNVRILFIDSHICVCVKPIGISSEQNGMPLLLQQQLGNSEVYPVHRLDQGVGGLMIFALSKESATRLTQAFSGSDIRKEYLSVMSPFPEGNEGTYTDLLFHDKRVNKTYVVKKERKGVKRADLAWILQEKQEKDGFQLGLIRIALHSGRSHQIRVQFGSRGTPIVGDGKYGSRIKSKSIALWSFRLSFRHPISGEMMDYSILPPKEYPWTFFETIHG